MSTTGFHCSTCGNFHSEMPMVLGNPAPAAWEAMPTEDRTEHCALTSDQCIIRGEHFFILGRLEIPVVDGVNPFTWLCWVSVSENNFDRACELWQQEGRESEPPYFAWVQSALPYPVGTLNLRASLVTRPLGERPLVLLQESDHPLYIEQSRGITMARVQQIIESALHEA
jgi:hypothetical protein